jgi:REP element-mobilizing transposase RayT
MDSHSIRKKLRLPSYNYFQTNRYFITICTHNKECIFGVVGGQTVQLSPLGLLVEQEWLHLTARFPNIDVVPFIVMPNHIHAVVTINHCSQHPLQGIALHPKKDNVMRWKRAEQAQPLRKPLEMLLCLT